MPFSIVSVIIELHDHERNIRPAVAIDIQLEHRKISAYDLFLQEIRSGSAVNDLAVCSDTEVHSPVLIKQIFIGRLCLDCVV